MAALTHDDFAAFFRAVWGLDPFPWQEDLLHRLATGRDLRRGYDHIPGLWPDVLDLPTGSGKTAVLDIAVFHLALEEAVKKTERLAPIRIAFIVDRRLIVDDAYVRAQTLARRLKEAIDAPSSADSVVLNVAQALCGLSRSNQPLLVRALRGGAPREDDWARTPVQPTILCSTVDQVGSRLLFRGYGLSDRMKPIHAGLLGSDCLILLDEAHLSEPFRQTLHAIEHLRAPDAAPFGFAVLTATPNVDAKRPFGLSAEDYSNPILSARITASKPARLVEVTGKQGIDTELRRVEVTCAEARATFSKLKNSIPNPAVGVVVNRVARARAVFERLRGELANEAEVILIIGPARPVDRENRTGELGSIRTQHSDKPRLLEKSLIIVATQTIEAGVDIDFDGLVTEAAALDALKQRFGRLNRGGRPNIKPEAVILAHKDDIATDDNDSPKADAVYGGRIKLTWTKLRHLAAESNDVVDFGIDALRKGISRNEANTLASPIVDAPIMLAAYADLWSQTWPMPNADPDVALFLHGPDRAPATVQIVWRADIDEQRDLRPAMEDESARSRLIELFKLVSPRAAEAIEVPLWAVRAWLERPDAKQANFSDVVERSAAVDQEPGVGRRAFRWAGEDERLMRKDRRSNAVYASALRNGDLIVVPADYGGCDEWGWNPECSEHVIDVAERAAWPYRARRFAVRVTPTLIAQGLRTEQRDVDPALPDKLATVLAETEDRSQTLLAAVGDLAFLPQRMKTFLAALGDRPKGFKHEFAYGVDDQQRPRGVVFSAPRGLRVAPADEIAAVPSTEGEDLGAMSDRALPLVKHSEHVRDRASAFTATAKLTAELREDICLSGYLHDLGKADPRYQAYYAGGDPYGPEPTEPLAKSGQRRLSRSAWERAQLPSDWRHEALSVRLAMVHPKFMQANDPALMLWLIGTHHGYGRPLFPHADPLDKSERRLDLPPSLGAKVVLAAGPGPQSLAFKFEGCDWSQLFAHLKEKYGIWGLARLEAFIRLADHRASEKGASQADQPYREAAE